MHNVLESLITDPSCCEHAENVTCIDLLLTNQPRSFQNSRVFETGLSYFYKMTATVMKVSFEKLQPRIINYMDEKRFQTVHFERNRCLTCCI